MLVLPNKHDIWSFDPIIIKSLRTSEPQPIEYGFHNPLGLSLTQPKDSEVSKSQGTIELKFIIRMKPMASNTIHQVTPMKANMAKDYIPCQSSLYPSWNWMDYP